MEFLHWSSTPWWLAQTQRELFWLVLTGRSHHSFYVAKTLSMQWQDQNWDYPLILLPWFTKIPLAECLKPLAILYQCRSLSSFLFFLLVCDCAYSGSNWSTSLYSSVVPDFLRFFWSFFICHCFSFMNRRMHDSPPLRRPSKNLLQDGAVVRFKNTWCQACALFVPNREGMFSKITSRSISRSRLGLHLKPSQGFPRLRLLFVEGGSP